jgi:hypothetical protein
MAQKVTFSHLWSPNLTLLQQNGPFFEFFLCLSRACLGKMFIFIYKWLKKDRFVTSPLAPLSPGKTPLLFECLPYVCLSRARLGKKDRIYMVETAQKRPLSHTLSLLSASASPSSSISAWVSVSVNHAAKSRSGHGRGHANLRPASS